MVWQAIVPMLASTFMSSIMSKYGSGSGQQTHGYDEAPLQAMGAIPSSGAMGGMGAGMASAIPQIMSMLIQQRMSKNEGRRAGMQQRKFMDIAYPGTNPWERLGSGQGGQAAYTASQERNTQERMQQRTLSMNKYVADRNALASVAGAVASARPDAATQMYNDFAAKTGSGPLQPGKSMPEKQYQAKLYELGIKEKDVNLKELQIGFERLYKDRDYAIAAANWIKGMYDSIGSNPWRTIISSLQDAGIRLTGKDNPLHQLQKAYKMVTGQEYTTPIPHLPPRGKTVTEITRVPLDKSSIGPRDKYTKQAPTSRRRRRGTQ